MLRRAGLFMALVVGLSAGSCSSDAMNEGCAEVCAEGSSCVEGKCKLDEVCAKPCEGKCCAANEFCSLATGACEIKQEEIKDCSTCKAYETCVKNACVACPNVVCGDVCCEKGFACDDTFHCYDPSIVVKDCQVTGCEAGESCDGLYPTKCFTTCDDDRPSCGYECCESDQICDAGKEGCYRQCSDSREPCGYLQTCCASGSICTDNACVLDCAGQGKGMLCGSVCCDLGSVCDAISKTCLTTCQAQQTRCGQGDKQSCCDNASQICYNNACIKRGAPCSETVPCDSFSEYCDSVSKTCVDMSLSPTHCIYQPPVGQFTPQQQWRYPGSVLGSAIVINLTDDNGDGKIDEHDVPDVVFVTETGALTVLSGDDGSLLAKSATKQYAFRNDLGAGKVNGDALPEIVVGSSYTDETLATRYQLIRIVNLVGTKGNYSLSIVQELVVGTVSYGNFTPQNNATDLHPSFVDVDNDGKAEIVTNRGIIGYNTSTKKYEFKCTLMPTWTSSYGANYLDDIIVADLDGDGQAELISRNIYDNKCQIILPHSAFPASSAAFSDSAHHFAVADLTGDGKPEIVRVADTRNSKTGTAPNIVYTMYKAEISIWKPSKVGTTWSVARLNHAEIPIVPERAKEANCGSEAVPRPCDCLDTDRTGFFCNAWGGPPVIADFDGDGKPDIGLASTWAYYVYRNDLSILWKDTMIQDWTSGRTGSSVFDFEGDGIAEVVYRDEKFLRVYAGPGDGTGAPKVLFKTPSTSLTVTEYPLIVDVDNDGNTEIVMVSQEGITAYRDTADNWIRTRRIWNQHSYHVTNINEDGSVPSPEKANWSVKGLNNYRQNVQTEGMFNAPNLVAAKLTHNLDNCKAGSIMLYGEIKNVGALGVPAGVGVNFYMRTPGINSGVSFVGRALSTKALGIGETATVVLDWNKKVTAVGGSVSTDAVLPGQFFFIVDGSASGIIGKPGDHNECHEDDNTLVDTRVEACPIN